MEILKTIFERWKAQTPSFFTKLKKLMIGLGTSAFTIWGLNQTMNLELPAFILTACKFIIVFSAASGMTAQLTKDNQAPNP